MSTSSTPSTPNLQTQPITTYGIILAAGAGKRMRSDLPKVAHVLLGKPLLVWSLDALVQAGIENICVVVSPHHSPVHEILKTYKPPRPATIVTAFQHQPLGTGHAASVAVDKIKETTHHLSECRFIITYGDVPAIQPETVNHLLTRSLAQQDTFTLLGFHTQNPTGYGRIVLQDNKFQRIVEEKDASDAEKKITLCNSGIICGSLESLAEILPRLKNENSAKEYYLTDVPLIGKNAEKKIGCLEGAEEWELSGVNSPEQLQSIAEKLKIIGKGRNHSCAV